MNVAASATVTSAVHPPFLSSCGRRCDPKRHGSVQAGEISGQRPAAVPCNQHSDHSATFISSDAACPTGGPPTIEPTCRPRRMKWTAEPKLRTAKWSPGCQHVAMSSETPGEIDFDFAVIGKGPFGSAAARHLSAATDGVVLIGPDEPPDRTNHDGVYASHYDQGRLTRRIASNRLWAEMTARTFEAMALLEAETGSTILRPVGCLTVRNPAVLPRHAREVVSSAVGEPVDHTGYEVDDESWRPRFPDFDFPAGCSITFESAPAGVLDPRALVASQIEVAQRQGAAVITDIVTATSEDKEGVTLRLASGREVRCGRMLAAVGSFINQFPLLPTRLGVSVESETFILGTVADDDGRRLTVLPTVQYSIDDPQIADIYMTPPLAYPDGRWKVKMGCNTSADSNLESLEAIQAWVRTGDTDRVSASMRGAMQGMLPRVEFLDFETGPCIITMTGNDHPIIDQVTERTFVAVAGNGMGAKASDGWGGLAARLMLDEPWPRWIDRDVLALR